MSIQSLANTPVYTENRRAAARQATASCASFQARLEKTAAGAAGEPESIHLCMGKDVAFSGGIAGKNGSIQEFCAHYTEDSTPEDPIVRISGMASGGPFDFICHINDVDPTGASYAELAALWGHLAKTGQGVTGTGPLPDTMEFREDITRKYDFTAGIRNSLNRPSHIIPTAASIAGANELLTLYQDHTSGAAGAAPAPCWGGADGGDVRSAASLDHGAFVKSDLRTALNEARLLLLQRTREGKEWKKEQEEWDRLMKCLDNWIEALRDAADRRERDGRSGGVTAEGGEALLGLYQGYIVGAAWAGAAEDPDLAREELLSALTETQSRLLERLEADKADEEDREAWADLLKRLDRWIERLRAERGEEEKRAACKASAIGTQTGGDTGK